MQIYADVLFLINFVMDFFVFFVVSVITKRKLKLIKLVFGSVIMAILYCLLVFIVEFKPFYSVFAATLILAIGVLITFSPKNIKELFKYILLANISAFSLGGIGIAFFYLTNTQAAINNFPIKTLAVSTLTFYILIKLFSNFIRKTALTARAYYPVKISYAQSNVILNALLDTGNLLQDPISKAPVIVAEFNMVKKFLPDGIKKIFYEKKENDLMLLTKTAADGSFAARVRIIPFASIGKQNGILFGFRPDKVEIIKDNNIITINNAIIGVYNFRLSKDGAFQGLLSTEII